MDDFVFCVVETTVTDLCVEKKTVISVQLNWLGLSETLLDPIMWMFSSLEPVCVRTRAHTDIINN